MPLRLQHSRLVLGLMRASACALAVLGCDGSSGDTNSRTDEVCLRYRDADGDGLGDDNASSDDCLLQAGWVEEPGDCNDGDEQVQAASEEIADGHDNDCDDRVDEGLARTVYRDADRDGYGDDRSTRSLIELTAGWVERAGDCADGDADVHPEAADPCDGIDNDCDGKVDEEAPVYYRDCDRDGYLGTRTAAACREPAAENGCTWISRPALETSELDCSDGNADVHPGAAEVCNNRDDDCNGTADQDLMTTRWYADCDGDGYTAGDDRSRMGCADLAPDIRCDDWVGFARFASALRAHERKGDNDCNDRNPDVFPGNTGFNASSAGIRDANCDGLEEPQIMPADLPACVHTMVRCDEVQVACYAEYSGGCSEYTYFEPSRIAPELGGTCHRASQRRTVPCH